MVHYRTTVLCAFVAFAVLFNAVFARPPTEDPEGVAIMCRLPAARGHCRALLPRWRYDPATGKCQEFKFGGCDGNGNNFMSYKACMAVCGGV